MHIGLIILLLIVIILFDARFLPIGILTFIANFVYCKNITFGGNENDEEDKIDENEKTIREQYENYTRNNMIAPSSDREVILAENAKESFMADKSVIASTADYAKCAKFAKKAKYALNMPRDVKYKTVSDGEKSRLIDKVKFDNAEYAEYLKAIYDFDFKVVIPENKENNTELYDSNYAANAVKTFTAVNADNAIKSKYSVYALYADYAEHAEYAETAENRDYYHATHKVPDIPVTGDSYIKIRQDIHKIPDSVIPDYTYMGTIQELPDPEHKRSDFQLLNYIYKKTETPFLNYISTKDYFEIFDLRRSRDYQAFKSNYKPRLPTDYMRTGFGKSRHIWWAPEISTSYYAWKLEHKNIPDLQREIFSSLLNYSFICDRLFLYPCCWSDEFEADTYKYMYSYRKLFYHKNHLLGRSLVFVNYGFGNLADIPHYLIEIHDTNVKSINDKEIRRLYHFTKTLDRRYCCMPVLLSFSEKKDRHALFIYIDTALNTIDYCDVNGSNDNIKTVLPIIQKKLDKALNINIREKYIYENRLYIHRTIKYKYDAGGRCVVWTAFIMLILNTFDVDIDTVIDYFSNSSIHTYNMKRMKVNWSIAHPYLPFTPVNKFNTEFELYSVYTFQKLIFTYLDDPDSVTKKLVGIEFDRDSEKESINGTASDYDYIVKNYYNNELKNIFPEFDYVE